MVVPKAYLMNGIIANKKEYVYLTRWNINDIKWCRICAFHLVCLRTSDRKFPPQPQNVIAAKSHVAAVHRLENSVHECIFTQKLATIKVWHPTYTVSNACVFGISCVVIAAKHEPKYKKYGSSIDRHTQSVLRALRLLFHCDCITVHATSYRSNHSEHRRCWSNFSAKIAHRCWQSEVAKVKHLFSPHSCNILAFTRFIRYVIYRCVFLQIVACMAAITLLEWRNCLMYIQDSVPFSEYCLVICLGSTSTQSNSIDFTFNLINA